MLNVFDLFDHHQTLMMIEQIKTFSINFNSFYLKFYFYFCASLIYKVHKCENFAVKVFYPWLLTDLYLFV